MNAPKKLILQAGNFYFHLIAKVFMQHSKFVPKIFLVRQQSFLFCHKSKRCATGPKSKDFGITLWAIKQNQAQSPDSALDLNWITWCAPLFFPSRLLGLLIKRIQFQNFSFREFNNPATRQIRNIYGGAGNICRTGDRRLHNLWRGSGVASVAGLRFEFAISIWKQ